MTKIIINVGRQIGSGGHIIAEKLAEAFGCKCYDRELLNLAAKESGFSEKFFEQNDEQKGFFKALFHTHLPFLSDSNFYHNDFSQEGLYKFQSDAIRKAADEGNCVFVGRTADYVLRDYKNVINISSPPISTTASRPFASARTSTVPLPANSSPTMRKNVLPTMATIPARNGDTARVTIYASTAACWDWKRLRNSSKSLSEKSLNYKKSDSERNSTE